MDKANVEIVLQYGFLLLTNPTQLGTSRFDPHAAGGSASDQALSAAAPEFDWPGGYKQLFRKGL